MFIFFRFLSFIFPWFFQTGVFSLNHSGQYEVSTKFQPAYVWANFQRSKSVGVCHGERDSFDITILPKGFLVNAKLNSQERSLKWVAVR